MLYLWGGLAALLITTIGIIIASNNSHGGSSPKQPTLSHRQVEGIETVYANEPDLICNGGKDIPLTANGQKFTCVGPDGSTHTFTITDITTGAFAEN